MMLTNCVSLSSGSLIMITFRLGELLAARPSGSAVCQRAARHRIQHRDILGNLGLRPALSELLQLSFVVHRFLIRSTISTPTVPPVGGQLPCQPLTNVLPEGAR
jgi:hypothetical protein